MTSYLYRLGRLCAHHPLVVIVIWVLIVAGVVFAARSYGQETSDDLTLPGTDSQAASDLVTDKFPKQANGSVPIVFRAPDGSKLTDDRYEKAIKSVTKSYANDDAVTKAIGPFDDEASGQLNKAKTTGLITLYLKDDPSELSSEEAERLIAMDKPLEKAGMDVAAGGYLGNEVSQSPTEFSEAVGLLAAVVILLFTFGTFVAMGLPILTAIAGLAVGMGTITLLSHVLDVPSAAPALATMIGLGVGIDYALFIVSRYRSQLAGGMEARESVARATATAGGAVVFAGGTVIIALLSLAAAGIPLVATLGYTATVVVLVAVVTAITLLPAVLGLLGLRINSLRLPGMRTQHDERPHGWARWAVFVGSRPWLALVVGLVVLLVLAVPVRSLQLGQVDNGAMPKDTQIRQSYDLIKDGFGPGANGQILVAVKLSKPAENDQKKLDDLQDQQQQEAQSQVAQQEKQADQQIQQQAQQEQTQADQQIEQQAQQEEAANPQDQAQIQQQAQQQESQQNQQIQGQAQQKENQENQSIEDQAKQQEQSQQNSASAQQAAEQESFLESKASDPRLVTLRDDLQKTKGVDSVSLPLVTKSGDAAIYTVTPTTSPSSPATEDLVDRLRENVIPDATKGKGMDASVGGVTAGYIDLAEEITDNLPLVIGIVLVLSFLVLLVAFRSLLVPLKAVVMNTVSILASFGVVTYAFSHDWSANLIGLEQTVPIVSFVPLMMFAVLFGLSMDYEVFLMTHIREQWKENGDPHEAVVHGLASTARVITSAALIMVSVFLAFVLSSDPTIKQFGLGMAVAVGVDATVVRCLLVPAIMSLLGYTGWWMPEWMERITPNFSIEGNEFFDELETAKTPSSQSDNVPEEPKEPPTLVN